MDSEYAVPAANSNEAVFNFNSIGWNHDESLQFLKENLENNVILVHRANYFQMQFNASHPAPREVTQRQS
jgi:hypothetical protein